MNKNIHGVPETKVAENSFLEALLVQLCLQQPQAPSLQLVPVDFGHSDAAACHGIQAKAAEQRTSVRFLHCKLRRRHAGFFSSC
jgi:hypothetical protein